jgi:hypothetical protein
MSTLAEIQNAVGKLPVDERKALLTWLASESETQMSLADEQQLLRSLDDAVNDIDAGKGVSIDDVRKRVRSWAAK